jgi:hypothetical protein
MISTVKQSSTPQSIGNPSVVLRSTVNQSQQVLISAASQVSSIKTSTKVINVILSVVLQLGPLYSTIATDFIKGIEALWLRFEDGASLLCEDGTHLLLE